MTEDDYVYMWGILAILILTVSYYSYCQGYHSGYKSGFMKGYGKS